MKMMMKFKFDEEDKVHFQSVFDVLNSESEPSTYILQQHHRCAAHTQNFVSTTDAKKSLDNTVFKKVSRSTFAKVQSIWNKQNRSTVAGDLIQMGLGHRLTIPYETRWNSHYYAIVRLHSVILQNGSALHRICDELEITSFSAAEENFI